jgi:CubicO group peptidase (beta-lactamase class C family)
MKLMLKNNFSKQHRLWCTFLFLVLNLTMFAQTRLLDSLNIALNGVIEKQMEASGLVGIGAAIVVDKKVVWMQGYGFADKENNKPFTPETIINIGSITKTITGICLMQAVEAGKLSLDEDINRYLPFKVINPNCPEEKITLRHLATHTSGLADRYPFYTDSVYCYNGEEPEALGVFLRHYFEPGGKYYDKDNFLDKKPGAYRDYSNIAASLAGYIVELAVGASLKTYGAKKIFKPLGMTQTGWSMQDITMSRHARLYSVSGDTVKIQPHYSIITYPDGGVRTSVADLSKLFVCLLNDGQSGKARLMQKETVSDMMRFQFSAEKHPENVDYLKKNSGIFWQTKNAGTQMGHGGSDPGIKTEMLCSLDKRVGVILFTNTTLGKKQADGFYNILDKLFETGKQLKRS